MARFLFSGLLQRRHDVAQFDSDPQAADECSKYEAMLRRGELCTFQAPPGQAFGRAGRRATLEDGERALEWCIEARPEDLQARVLQLRNLMTQGMGREREVPHRAITALQEAGVSGCDVSSSCYIKVLQIALLGFKALQKQKLEGASIPQDPAYPAYTTPTFLAAAAAAVPGMAGDLLRLAERMQRHLCSSGPEGRRRLLADRSYMSCIDLQFVSGEHHAGGGEAAGMMVVSPRELEQARIW